MGIVENLSPHQLQSFNSLGYMVMESFASPDEIKSMRKRMDQLLHDFDPSSSSVFSTKNQLRTSNDHFFDSAEKVSFFFEEWLLENWLNYQPQSDCDYLV